MPARRFWWDRFDDARGPMVEAADPSPLPAQIRRPYRSNANRARRMQSFGDTVFVYDFGVNMSGVCRLSVEGEPGTTLSLKHGELLKDNGRVEMGNIDIYFYPQPGVEFQTDFYTLRGEGRETFEPDFTYHGFRYVEVKADRPVRLEKDDLT
ncbi:MAG: family 78 glycoside hydrolase catalytic domain, partial [Alistipes onderdonkii]